MNSRPSENEERLRAAMRAVANSTQQESAPDAVEANLLHAFRENATARPGFAWKRWILPVAALLVLALTAAIWQQPEISAVSPVVTNPFEFTMPSPPADAPLVFAKAPARPAPQQESARTVTSEFMTLGYSDPSPGSYQIVRVKMDRSSLAQFGVPVNPDRNELLDADLLVGDDGMPRAVRFVTFVSDRN